MNVAPSGLCICLCSRKTWQLKEEKEVEKSILSCLNGKVSVFIISTNILGVKIDETGIYLLKLYSISITSLIKSIFFNYMEHSELDIKALAFLNITFIRKND